LLQREYYQLLFDVKEKNAAAYGQLDFKGSRWSANVGVRVVRTDEDVTRIRRCRELSGAITTSLFGPFAGLEVKHSYTNVLESANLKVDLRPDWSPGSLRPAR